MKLAKYETNTGEVGVGAVVGEQLAPLALNDEYASLTDILEAEAPGQIASELMSSGQQLPLAGVKLLPPIDAQEVWAAGVTYTRSKTARMEESEAAASCYDRVYASPRPELFMKATPHRVSGPGQALRIREDAEWNVPEPELTLVMNTRMQLVGFTIGNDMSSRDIEGDNPLYLPQAKVYNQCAGLGPWITLATAMPPRNEIGIALAIRRDGQVVFDGQTGIDQLARTFEELIGWLARDNSFPTGVMLMTGTGIVPDSDFTLHPGDLVDITIDGIGTLSNPIVQG
ncbi:MAG: fumarylacetoacetate hydrolase family protein [Planctomycetaceae bacterium]|nr:fumarylacetoacetate hydrolase family protein [Planctomycetales bacterium]MCB9923437.1 fumarylacetoacetate hydrolase family protein [Planctomycetaceae bacterium]